MSNIMRIKKSVVFALMSIFLIMTLGSCGDRIAGKTNTADENKICVVTSNFPPYDFTRAIAGDLVDVSMLLPPGSESHSFEPSPQDILMIQNCDIFLYSGGENDAWVGRILESLEPSDMRVIAMIDCVDTVTEEIVEGMEDDEHEAEAAESESHEHEAEAAEGEEAHADGEHAGESAGEDEHAESEGHEHEGEEAVDEHVWTSPKNAQNIVQKITDTLSEIDPGNASAYQANADAYKTKLGELDAAFREVVDSAARKTIVFGDRFPFRYFADEYGLEYFAAFPGCSTETEPSAATVKFLIDKIDAEQIPVVFHIELSTEKMADTISEATGAKKLLLHSCHNITRDDFESGENYLSLMTANIDPLRDALS